MQRRQSADRCQGDAAARAKRVTGKSEADQHQRPCRRFGDCRNAAAEAGNAKHCAPAIRPARIGRPIPDVIGASCQRCLRIGTVGERIAGQRLKRTALSEFERCTVAELAAVCRDAKNIPCVIRDQTLK